MLIDANPVFSAGGSRERACDGFARTVKRFVECQRGLLALSADRECAWLGIVAPCEVVRAVSYPNVVCAVVKVAVSQFERSDRFPLSLVLGQIVGIDIVEVFGQKDAVEPNDSTPQHRLG